MSNGFHGCGSANAEFKTPPGNEYKGRIGITSNWSRSSNWVELRCDAADGDNPFAIFLDLDNADAHEFAACVLRAVGEEEFADTLLAKNTKVAEREAAREQALAAGHAAEKAAKAALLAATTKEREAFDATMDAVEDAYQEATGERMRFSRWIDWDKEPF